MTDAEDIEAPELAGLDPETRAPERLGLTTNEYVDLVEALADQLAEDDPDAPVNDMQRGEDLETAEWMLGIIYAAGWSVRPHGATAA